MIISRFFQNCKGVLKILYIFEEKPFDFLCRINERIVCRMQKAYLRSREKTKKEAF